MRCHDWHAAAQTAAAHLGPRLADAELAEVITSWCQQALLSAAARDAVFHREPTPAYMLGHHDETTTKVAVDVGGLWARYAPGDHTR